MKRLFPLFIATVLSLVVVGSLVLGHVNQPVGQTKVTPVRSAETLK